MSFFSSPQILYAPDDPGGAGGLPGSNVPGAGTASPKGVSPAAKKLEDVLKSLDDSNKRLYRMLNKTLGMDAASEDDTKSDKTQSKGLVETLQDDLLTPLKEMFDPSELLQGLFGEDTSLFDLLGGESSKQKPKEKPKMNDMMRLSAGDAMGFTFLYWKLDEIAGLLRGEGESDRETRGKGLGGFFQGLLKGATGLAILAGSMMIFAGALLLFTKLEGSDWAKALAGIGMFALFVAGAVVVAKLVAKEEKTFFDFAKGVLALTASLVLFGAAIFVMAWVKPYVPDAVDGMRLFGIFVAGAVIVSHLVGENLKNFAQLGIGMIALTGALILFGAAIFVMDLVRPLIPGAKEGIEQFLIFIGVASVLSRIVGTNIASFGQFALGSLLLTAALGLFAGAIWVVNTLAPTEAVIAAIPAMAAMLVLSGIGVAVGYFLGGALPGLIAFGIGSMLLSAAVMLFGVAVRSIQSIPIDDLVQAGAIVLAMSVLSVAAAGVGLLLAGPLLPGILGFTIGAAALTAGTVLFGLAVRSIKGITLEDLGVALAIVGSMGLLVGAAAAVGVALLFALPALGAFAAAAGALSLGMVALGEAIKAVRDSGEFVDDAMPALQKMMKFLSNPDGAVDADGKSAGGGYPGVIQLMDGMNRAVRRKMRQFGEALIPFSEGMLNFAEVIRLVAEIGSPELINAAVYGVGNMMGFLVGGGPAAVAYEESVAGMMEGMKRRVATRIEDFGNALGPLSSALLDFTEVIRQTAGMKDDVELAKPAIRAMIAFLVSGTPREPSIASLLASITPRMSERMGAFGEGLTPLSTGLNTFAEVVHQVKNISPEQLGQAIDNLDGMMLFLQRASGIAADVGGGKFLGLGSTNMEKFEEAIAPFGNGVRSFISIARDIGSASENVQTSETMLRSMVRMLTAAGAVVDQSGNPQQVGQFKNSLDLLGDGINRFTGQVEGSAPFVLDRIADALERIAEIQFGQMFTPFIQFMDHNEKLVETATQLERISEAITPREPTTLDRIGGAIGSIFNRGGDRANIDDREVEAYMNPTGGGGGSIEENVSVIARIISSWNDAPPITLANGEETNVILMQGAAASQAASSFGGGFGG